MRLSRNVMEISRLKYWTHGPGHRKKDGRMERERKVKGREGNGKVENKKERKGEGEKEWRGEGRESQLERGRKREKAKGKGKEKVKEKKNGK